MIRILVFIFSNFFFSICLHAESNIENVISCGTKLSEGKSFSSLALWFEKYTPDFNIKEAIIRIDGNGTLKSTYKVRVKLEVKDKNKPEVIAEVVDFTPKSFNLIYYVSKDKSNPSIILKQLKNVKSSVQVISCDSVISSNQINSGLKTVYFADVTITTCESVVCEDGIFSQRSSLKMKISTEDKISD